jgi:CHAD domain-containing protein
VENGESRWQLKLPQASGRLELESDGDAVPPRELCDLVTALLAGRKLAPAATLRTRRRGLRVREGDGAADVVADDVTVLDGGHAVDAFGELEVELVSGSESLLDALERRLRHAGAESGSGEIKLERVLGASPYGQDAAPAKKAPPLEHLRWRIRTQLEEIGMHDPGVRLDTDPEELHDLRVAVRRLRAMLRAARPMLELEWSEAVRTELGWLGGELGPLRDADVFLTYLAEQAATVDERDRSALDELVGLVERDRERARERVLRALRSERYLELLQQLELAGQAPRVASTSESLRGIARGEFRKLRKAARRITPAAADDELHAFRIRGKRARYAAELASTTAGKRVRRFLREAKRFQDVSGEHQDAAVAEERLRALNAELLEVPEGFTVHPKLAKQLERRVAALDEGAIDWGQAEALAFASLLVEGIPVRLTGQDTERGTFSHRHIALHDARTGEVYKPIQHLGEATASFEVHNSPLSELAAVGFEYGYSVAAAETLVLWEAQFGDFVNGAQIIVDQFMVSGLSKWRQTSRLTLLLPHGYEGNGPEHSSGRLERFLQLAAQENIRIANCTTAGQYFHLLRRQALDAAARPLVVMTPKGLLRLRQATSSLAELAEGAFRPVLDDPDAARDRVRRLVLCSGKIYYDVVGHEARGEAEDVAVARIEQLYPFPVEAAAQLLRSYPALEEVVWAQEEPQNMGAWRAIRHRLEEALPPSVPLSYAGRPWRASPSEGYPTAHLREQDRIVRDALGR